MAKLDQEQLELVITNGKQHTYRSLRALYSADHTQAMQIDRTLQKLRRHKKIAFTRNGCEVIWRAVRSTSPQVM
jgi:hypothetical protein